MKLVLPLRDEWPQQPAPPGTLVQVAPALTLYYEPLLPLPFDLQKWGDQIVMANVPAEYLVVHAVSDVQTEGGWPVTLVKSDVLNPETRQPEVRRIHALYRFTQYGSAALCWGDPEKMAEVEADVLKLFLRGRPDFSTGEVISLSQLWEGMVIERADKGGKKAAQPED